MSRYGCAVYGISHYGDDPGLGDTQTVWYEIVRADRHNTQTDDLTAPFFATRGNQVDLNHDRAVRSQASLAIRTPDALRPYRDYVAIWLNRSYGPGHCVERAQLGLFGVRVPSGTRTIQRADAIYTGYDLTATLARSAFTQPYEVGIGVNYVQAVIDIIALAGLTRTLIEATDQLTAKAISFATGTTYLEAANVLLQAIGYYTLSCLPDGRLFSMPGRALSLVEPYRVVTDDDLMAPVEPQPLDTTVANIVIVIKDDPSEAPLVAVRRNDDPASPTSTVNLGDIPRIESVGDLKDQDAVDALAERLLSEGRSFYQTAKLVILPDPRALIPHQTIELALSGELAILNGRWWVRTAKLPLDTRATELEINRTTDSINGVLL